MFPIPYAPQSLCSPVHLFPSPYRYSPVPMFPSPYVPPTSSPVPLFPSPIPQKCFPFPIFPTHDSKSLSSPNMFPSPYAPQLVHQSLCSPVLFHRSILIPRVPQTCSTVPMFPQLVHQFLCSPVRIFSDIPLFHMIVVSIIPISVSSPMFPKDVAWSRYSMV